MDHQLCPRELALFAGAGGGILGSHLLGFRTVCAVEWDAYAASVLCARQNEGVLPLFPIWSDVQTFDGVSWRGLVDVVSGGFPCQDISTAGKGAGIDGKRSGMWVHMARIIGEVRPRFAFVENSPALTSRGLGRVLGDLAELGYDAEWCVLGAADVGAPHQRDRIWILAADALHGGQRGAVQQKQVAKRKAAPNAGRNGKVRPLAGRLQRKERRRPHDDGEEVSDASGARPQGRSESPWTWSDVSSAEDGWPIEPDVGRVAHGLAARVDRLRCIGNGQVPTVAAAAFVMLARRFEVTK